MNRFTASVIAVTLCALTLCPSAMAQISEGGYPPSFDYTTRSIQESDIDLREIYIPFTRVDLMANDQINANAHNPKRIAQNIAVDLSVESAGTWSTLPNGQRIWQLGITAPDAIATMLYYNKFVIPEGGKLYIYNSDRSQVLGAYTHTTHTREGAFATEFIAGDEVMLEYVSPEVERELPQIEISEIGYGYDGMQVRAGWGTTSSCMVDINCEEGDNWQTEQRSVARLIVKIGSGSYLCSGSMINNTAQDRKPMLLTAHHCREAYGKLASTEDMQQWMFYFNYQKKGCNTNESEPTADVKTLSGCLPLVDIPLNGGSDALLLLLNSDIPQDYNVYYNGWDRTTAPSQMGVNIHHPDGDAKKISTYTVPAESYTFEDSYYDGEIDAFWNVVFAETANGHGITAGGSSGSPLYNERHLLVGTLTGGDSYCSNLDGTNIYGKFTKQWGNSDADSMLQLGVHLDPLKTDVLRLSGLDSRATQSSLTIKYKDEIVCLSDVDGEFSFIPNCGDTDIELTILELPEEECTINGQSGRTIYHRVGEENNTYQIQLGEFAYTVAINELSENILIQRWENVISVINNPENNGGYDFSLFNWYCNGEIMIGEYKSYLTVPAELEESTFYAQLMTSTGLTIQTCEFKLSDLTTSSSEKVETPQNSINLLSNQLQTGESMTIRVGVTEEEMQQASLMITNSSGSMVGSIKVMEEVITLPAPTTKGFYIITLLKGDGERESLKFIVK